MDPENVRTHETTFEAADGLQLHERRWLPEGDAKAVVALLHGGAEHTGRYAHVANFLNHHGYAVAAFDLRGHGRSEGQRMFGSAEEHLDDVERFLGRLRHTWPQSPLFLFGHSMGGTIATLLVLTRPVEVAGLVLSGPLLRLGENLSPLKIGVAKLLGRLLPRLPVEKLDATYISRDEGVVRRYEADPLVYHGGIPARPAADLLPALRRIEAEEVGLRVPLLLLHGADDRLADMEGSKRLYRRAGSDDKTLKLYEGYYHEVLNEPGKERVMEDLLEWLESRLDGGESAA